MKGARRNVVCFANVLPRSFHPYRRDCTRPTDGALLSLLTDLPDTDLPITILLIPWGGRAIDLG